MSLSVIAATSPPPSAEVVLPAPTMFRAGNYIDNSCLRCRKTVYPTDKIGPLKDYTFFHSGCFRCIECNSKLTLKTYFNNQVSECVVALAFFKIKPMSSLVNSPSPNKINSKLLGRADT